MNLKIYSNYEALSEAAASKMAELVASKPEALLCLATGDSPRRTYELFVEKIKQSRTDISRCSFIGLDEWLGISPGKVGTCHHFLFTRVFEPLKLAATQIHVFDGMATDPKQECEKMNAFIQEKGGIDFVLVGVGMNGHIGFNEPGADEKSRAHVIELHETTTTVGQKYFDQPEVIRRGITVGLQQVLEAKTMLMIANGEKKAAIIQKTVADAVNAAVPSTFVRKHANGFLWIDEAAASKLRFAKEAPLIPAFKKDQALVQEMDDVLNDGETLFVWWLGQSGFLLQWNGKRVLLDPYLSDALTKKYAQTGKPHVRMSERVIDPELLRHINVVTSSHNHTDHLDAETLMPVLKNNPGAAFLIPEANRAFVAERVGCEASLPVGLTAGKAVTLNGIGFHGIPARHNEIDRDEHGNCKYMGFVVELGPYKIYHSGDTLWFEGMEEQLKPFALDAALLPVNGNDPARKVAGNLNGGEAAALGKAIGAGIVIPCHYDMFTFNTADVNDFAAAAEQISQPYKIVKGGEMFEIRK